MNPPAAVGAGQAYGMSQGLPAGAFFNNQASTFPAQMHYTDPYAMPTVGFRNVR